jgi:Holliday junction resolvasome RuvABC endonuclease subunit
VQGSPIEQGIVAFAKGINPSYATTYVLERLHTFRNANTTRSLLERYGYLKYLLQSGGYRVEEVSPRMARKHLGLVEKEEVYEYFKKLYTGLRLTSHMTDALAVALYQADRDGYEFRPGELLLTEDLKP